MDYRGEFCCAGGGGGSNPFDQLLNTFNSPQFEGLTLVPGDEGDGQLTARGVNLLRPTVASPANITFGTLDTGARYRQGLSSATIGLPANDNYVLTDQGSNYLEYAPYGTQLLLHPNQVMFGLSAPYTVVTPNGNIFRTSFLLSSPSFVGSAIMPIGSIDQRQMMEVTVYYRYNNRDPILPAGTGFRIALYMNDLEVIGIDSPVTGGGPDTATFFFGMAKFKVFFYAINTSPSRFAVYQAGAERYAESFVQTQANRAWAYASSFTSSGAIDLSFTQSIDLSIQNLGTTQTGQNTTEFLFVDGRMIT